MPKEDWKTNTIQNIFTEKGLYPLNKIETILDVGCGLSLKSQYIDAKIRVGVDIYKPFLEKIEADCPYIVINSNAMMIDRLFMKNSFDIVLITDLIEHLDKDDSFKLLDMAKEIAKVAVIIETPLGYIPQNIDIWGYGGHEYQTHRSSWCIEDFTNIGYKTFIRDYKMSDVKRHTELETDLNIKLIDAILLCEEN